MQTFDSLANRIELIRFSEGSNAKLLIRQLYEIAKQHPENQSLRQKCLYHESELNYTQGSYDSLLTRAVQIELLNTKIAKTPFYDALMHYSLAMNNVTKGNYGNAFTLSLYAAEHFKKMKDSVFITKSLMLLGRICIHIENFQMAENYYEEARSYTTPEQITYYQIYTNIIYITQVCRNKLGAAADSLLKILPLIENKDMGLLVSIYVNLGNIYFRKEDYTKSYEYLTHAEKLSESIDNLRFFAALYQTMGSCQMNMQNITAAYYDFQKAKAFAVQADSPDLIVNILLYLSHIHEKQHHTDSSLFYLKAYNDIRNGIDLNASSVKAYQSYISVFLESSKQELIIKEQEIAIKNKRFGMALISAIALLILIIALLVIIQQQRQNTRQQALHKEAEKKDLEERLIAKQEIQRLQEDRIELQMRELTSYSLALSNKNDILQQIATIAQRLTKEKPAVDEIQQVIKNNLSTDKVWADFVLHFEKVHPAFFDNIKAHCATLSETDLRLCAYFRIGLSAKQISQILNVSPDSIKMHRYRIKKKLNLPEESNLDDFIRNI